MSIDFICISDKSALSISAKTVKWSPMLGTMLDTKVGVDTINGAIVFDDLGRSDLFHIYSNILNGNIVDPMPIFGGDISDYDEFVDFLSYMGHDNVCEYPSDVFVYKVINQFWRDNYRLFDIKSPFSGLECIETAEDLHVLKPGLRVCGTQITCDINARALVLNFLRDELGVCDEEICYIAGSFAMYLAGYVLRPNDCDVFVVNKDAIVERITKMNKNDSLKERMTLSEHAINITYNIPHDCLKMFHEQSREHQKIAMDESINIQIVTMKHSSPTSILHHFDIDCCQVLYNPVTETLWTTTMGLCARRKKMNYFDCMQASKSYVYRMIKYACRGYEIYMPFWDEVKWCIDPEKGAKIMGCYGKLRPGMTRESFCDLDNHPVCKNAQHKNVDLIVLMKIFGIVLNDRFLYAHHDYYDSNTPKPWRNIELDQENYDRLMKYAWTDMEVFTFQINGTSMPVTADKDGFLEWYKTSKFCEGLTEE